MPPLIMHIVAAKSGTGKTTLIEKLIPLLKLKGLRVAALKGNLHHYKLDQEGKDSWRLLQTGAEVTGFTADEDYFLHGKSSSGSALTTVAELLQDFNLILVEGNKQSPYKKIEVVRRAIQENPIIPLNTVAIASDDLSLKVSLPIFDLEDPNALADFIFELSQPGEKDIPSGEESFTHFDDSGRPKMVDVSAKEQTEREAYARGEITMNAATLDMVKSGHLSKGDVLGVAQVAAIMAVKETGRLIPMAHPLGISGVEVDFGISDKPVPKIEIGVRVKLTGQTGVEMEALTGVSVASLTIYDMCKAVDKNMVIQNIRLIEKKGGRSGHFLRDE